jgi:ubiquinone/menaquinone biosynthesis C-methylase UbiE
VRYKEERYFLTMTGACFLSDDLTRVNMDVVQDCCFQAAYYLGDSIREEKPVGLHKVFGDWETIYPALSKLPAAARDSWFRWDHYYSDAAFPEALPLVFERRPRNLLDVGGNTGKWSMQCARYSREVAITLLDHPGQVNVARENIEQLGLADRITCHPIDLLDHSQPLPAGFDAVWMSQFLVCFSEEDVLQLLKRAAAALAPEGRLYILDTFWDRQEHEASTYSLQAISLYFTFLANGRSRMYKAADIIELLHAAGLEVERESPILGVCSTLLVCRRTNKGGT